MVISHEFMPLTFALYLRLYHFIDYGMAAYLEKKSIPPEKVAYLVDSELLNGRLAMLGFMGMHCASAANGSHFPFLSFSS